MLIGTRFFNLLAKNNPKSVDMPLKSINESIKQLTPILILKRFPYYFSNERRNNVSPFLARFE